MQPMSDRDENGRFVIGNKTAIGRPRGSRAKLSENFLGDLCEAWEEHGPAALLKCATTEPVQFCKIVANLMPAKMEAALTVTHDLSEEYQRAVTYADAWRVAAKARALIGAEPLPEVEVLNDDD
jgi:hypothetical protein